MKSKQNLLIKEKTSMAMQPKIPLSSISSELLLDLKRASEEYEDVLRTKGKIELALKAKERRFMAALGLKSIKKGGVIVDQLMNGKRDKLMLAIQHDVAKFLADNYVSIDKKDHNGDVTHPGIVIKKDQNRRVTHARSVIKKDHPLTVTHMRGVIKKDQNHRVTQAQHVSNNGHHQRVTQGPSADLILDFIDRLNPHLAALEPILTERDRWENTLKHLATKLPVWPWVERDVKGVGGSSLARIVGATVNKDFVTGKIRCIDDYPSPAKLWKRMGLGMVQYADGTQEIQKRSKEYGTIHKYNPVRRSLMHVVGECIVKANDYYKKEIYDSYRVRLEAKYPEWETAKTKDGAKAHPGHYNKCAMRYMEKKFLKDLWVEWHKALGLYDRIECADKTTRRM
jgi:hypothetical protein